MSDLSGYKNIFKTTFLFGFVQVFNIFVKVGINKVVAILLGTAGMGDWSSDVCSSDLPYATYRRLENEVKTARLI